MADVPRHPAAQWLGLVPAATGPHTPSVPEPWNAAVQAWQAPVQAVLQQTPSTQKPLAHCLPSPPVHVTPLA
jgi:hypothetical protein